jgi:hypothetical protein
LGNFLIIVPSVEQSETAQSIFKSALEAARRLEFPSPSAFVEAHWAFAASFPRQNRSGTPVVRDPRTGSWLLTIGTWFHEAGMRVGDEQQLLERYMRVGADQLARELEGFYVIAIGDIRTSEVVLLTDVIGSCHCFLRQLHGGTAVSSSSLLLASLDRFHLDPIACQEFLNTGIIFEDRTICQEVRKLGPASLYRFASGARTVSRRYWSVGQLAADSLQGEQTVEALWKSLQRAVKKVGIAFEHIVCDLTGGYDSRSIVAAFLGAGVKFSTVVSGLPTAPDVLVSQQLAELFGLPHTHLVPDPRLTFDHVCRALPFTDGEYDLVEYARILHVHSALSQDYDISINGSFGEVARGYWWELLFPWVGARRKLDARKVARLRYAASLFDVALFPPRTRLDLVQHLADVMERTNEGLFQLPNTLQMDNAYLTLRMQRWQGRIASSTNRLWPCLSPFMFRSVLEAMLQADSRLRQRSLLVRRMLERFQPKLGEAPLEHGYPAMPVTWKNLHRFWPVPKHYARRALQKIASRMSRAKPAAALANNLPPRLQLWQDPRVRELLRPNEMRVARLLDMGALERFLKRSEEPGFLFDSQWTRMLTLEYTLRVLETLGVEGSA